MSYRNASASPLLHAGRPRDDERERAILHAAIELVAEVGYDRMSMDAVATRARASKATIYRRWPGKAELVLDAVEHLVGDKEEFASSGELRADLLRLLGEMRTKFEGEVGDLMAGLAVAAQRDPALAAAVRSHTVDSNMCDVTSGLIDEAVTRGELPTGADSTLLDDVLPALLLFRKLRGEAADDAYLVHIIDDLLLPALRRSSAEDRIAPSSPPRRPRSPRSPRKEPRS